MNFKYTSGEEIRDKDRIKYHGEEGEVEFVITRPTGVADMDWYLEQFPGGGFMVNGKNIGREFITEQDTAEELEFVGRGQGT